MEFIAIGQIVAPRGTRGKFKVKILTDFPQRFAASSTVYINRQAVTIENAEWHRGMAVIKVPAVDSRQEAEALRGAMVEIPLSQVHPLPEGQYYHFQLIGLEVWTSDGELLGKITSILSAESNDNYVVSGKGGELLIPAIEDVVKSVDLEKKRMVIEPMEGLLGLNKTAGG